MTSTLNKDLHTAAKINRATIEAMCDGDLTALCAGAVDTAVSYLIDLHQEADHLDAMADRLDAMEYDTAVHTYECPCGQETHPLYEPADGDLSTWCMCGLRVADTRAIALRLIEQAAATQ